MDVFGTVEIEVCHGLLDFSLLIKLPDGIKCLLGKVDADTDAVLELSVCNLLGEGSWLGWHFNLVRSRLGTYYYIMLIASY